MSRFINDPAGRTIVALLFAASMGGVALAAEDDVRGEDRDLQHEQMQGSESEPAVTPPGKTEQIEMEHEQMQGSDSDPVAPEAGKDEHIDKQHEKM